MAKQCPNCQQLLDEAVRFCPICGSQVSEIKPVDAPIQIAEGQLPPPLIPDSAAQPRAPLPLSSSVPPLSPPQAPLMRPALLAGIVLAVLSALPVVSCCCLIWLVGGGVLAVYFLRNEMAGEISPGLGARLGLLTALFGAVFWQLLDLPMSLIDGRGESLRQIEELIRNTENLPAESIQIFERFLAMFNNPFNPAVIVFGILSKLFLCGVLTTLGGVLGVAFFGKPKSAGSQRPV